jgi:hypothetical protein
LLGAKRRSNTHHKFASSNDDRFNLDFESRLDPAGACLRGGNGSVEFKIVRHATMDAVILPPRKADQPVPALPFPRLQHIEWSEKANEVNFVLCQKSAIVLSSTTTKHHIIDDQVIALMGHGSDGTAHATHRSLHHRPGLDGYGWLALILRRLETQPIRMSDHPFRSMNTFIAMRRNGSVVIA